MYCTGLYCIFRNTREIKTRRSQFRNGRVQRDRVYSRSLLHICCCTEHLPLSGCCLPQTSVPSPWPAEHPVSSFCAPVARAWCLDGVAYSFWGFAGTCRFCGTAHLWNGLKSRPGECWDAGKTPQHSGRRQALACAQACQGVGHNVFSVHTPHLQNPHAMDDGRLGEGSEVGERLLGFRWPIP
jgi:hypothetical protein